MALGIGVIGALGGVGSVKAAVAPPSTVRTPLPTGWELCVLQQVGAPVTAANVDDLDMWQLAEGGSTNNDYAYNPYNTMRATDATNHPLTATIDKNGFPSFPIWPNGCLATAATILQPNMAGIEAALKAGNYAPAGAFLTAVDTTPWCAPDNGVPCYSDLIASDSTLPAAGSSVPVPPDTPAVALYKESVQASVAYHKAVANVAAVQATLLAQNVQLQQADDAIAADQQAVDHAKSLLHLVAVYEYTSDTAQSNSPALEMFDASPVTQQLKEHYASIDIGNEIQLYQQALATLAAAQAHRKAVFDAINATSGALADAQDHAAKALARVGADVDALHAPFACIEVPALQSAANPNGLGPDQVVPALDACLASLAPPPRPPAGPAAPVTTGGKTP